MELNEKDWKLFRQKLPEWQEAYMEKLIEEYKGILNNNNIASDKFWELDKRIKSDKKSTGVIVHNARRSQFLQIMFALWNDGVISADDLDGFSEELRDALAFMTSHQ